MIGAAEQLAVRTSMPTPQLMELVRARVRVLDPNVTVMPLRGFAELVEVPLARPRFYTVLLTGFSATGVALAVFGLYGVIATGVRQRRREFGVRMALGAEAGHVRRLVLVDGVWLVGSGILVGLAVAVVAAQALRGLLYGVELLIRCRSRSPLPESRRSRQSRWLRRSERLAEFNPPTFFVRTEPCTWRVAPCELECAVDVGASHAIC